MPESNHDKSPAGVLARLKRRGVLRVAFSYAVIAWLVLQIADVVLDPFDIGEAVMRVLLVVVALGFPVALALAWFFELTPHGIEVDHEAPGAPRPAAIGVRRYADIIIIGLLVIVVGFLLARQGGLIEEAPSEQVVAILPFTNLSPEAQDAYFGEGLADTLIQKLGQLGELVVLASQSTFEFTGRDLDLKVVGTKLGATAIMTGSVQRAGNALRINARLVEVDSGKQLWSDSFDRGVQDVFAVQDEIAVSVTRALHLVLASESQQRLATPATTNLTAYDAYVLGVSRLARRNLEDRQRALDYFRQAIDADPDYALAYTGLVEALYLESFRPSRTGPVSALVGEAKKAAQQALELQPDLGEAWLARAQVAEMGRQTRDGQALPDQDIIATYEKAVELSPNNAMAYKYFSNFLVNSHTESERAMALMKKAAQLDPRSGIIKVNIGNHYESQGEYALAEQWYRRAVGVQDPYFQPALMVLTDLYATKTARLDEAARWARAWRLAGPDDPLGRVFEQDVYMNLGDWERARTALGEIAAISAAHSQDAFNSARWGELNQGMLMARRNGDLETAAALARQQSAEFWQPRSTWPVLQDVGYYSYGMTTLALYDISQGQTETALKRYEAAYPGSFEDIDAQYNDVLRPVVMLAALYKRTGDRAHAEKLLQDYLDFVRDPANAAAFDPHDWTEFTILAMLGETDAALAELEAVVDSGYLYQWYMLKDGAFDPDYAAVLADPRFEALYGRVTTKVDEQRTGFQAQPGLPEGAWQ